ncbi:MAG: LuxR C-terminal-related transcriptional regulator [Bacteroidota bacterium]
MPAFIYYLQHDSYLTASQAILRKLNLSLQGLRFQSFLERIHPHDRVGVLSNYAREMPELLRHREGESQPLIQSLYFRILDQNKRYRHAIVKMDIAGYDAHGHPDKLLGIFWLDDVPLANMEKACNQGLDAICGEVLANRISAVHRNAKSMMKKQNGTMPVVTPRERDIMKGLAQGFSTKLVAEQLGISFHTVETHRKVLLQKFKARNTVQMMLKAGRLLPGSFWR